MKKLIFLIFNIIMLSIGNCGGPLISRLYFIHGGQRIWIPSVLQTVGCPIILIPLSIAYFQRRKIQGPEAKLVFITRQEFIASAGVGIIVGLDSYLNSWGPAKLPVSTSTLINATQLAFTALFAVLIVKQKLTAYSTNSVVLLIAGAATLALRANGDRPAGESTKDYMLGFVMTFIGAVLYGLMLPLIELIYMKAKQAVTYTTVLEIQMVLGISATVFCTIGMIINKDFQAIPREASQYAIGESKYYMVLVWCAIIWQFALLGLIDKYLVTRIKPTFPTKKGSNTNFFYITRQEFTSSAALGILVGLAGYLYAWGPAKLPVSTSTVIYAAQLGFTVVFAFLIVKQKLTAYSVNAVVLLIVGAGTLALRAECDRPEGESTKQYVLGFVMTLLAAASTGLALPLLELIYIKAKKNVTYIMILEIQMILNIFGSAFCTVGMIVNKDFQAISREANQFELGKSKYYLVLVWSAIIWQFSTLGIVGVVQYGSSLLCGILIALLLPLTELLGLILYHETFQVTKGLAIFLSLWGFVSYFYGEMKQSKKNKKKEENPIPQTEMVQTSPV
ncbi:hypothetical protein KY289_021514 [Solanum tuberosum]|nr:hypothetical protein KY289_021514 [Solanum tuberosum]